MPGGYMILQSEPKVRPYFKLQDGHWIRIDTWLSANGESIVIQSIEKRVVDQKDLVNIADITGVCAYFNPTLKEVYDFSSSHLCPKQLELIKVRLCS